MAREKFTKFPNTPEELTSDPATFLMAVVAAFESFDILNPDDRELRLDELREAAEEKGLRFPTDEEIAIASDELDEIGDLQDTESKAKLEAWISKHNQ